MGQQKKSSIAIALDVMGGEEGVGAHIVGAYRAIRNRPSLVVHLFGDESQIRKALQKIPPEYQARLPIHHCTEQVNMEDHAGVAARKKDSSMYRSVEAVRDFACDAAVSAGHSGAMMACSLFLLKRIEGFERPAIMVKFPTVKGYTVLLDMGANVDCKAAHLAQFALMGDAYAKAVEKLENPRIGLLSNGTEKHKGNEVVREAAVMLASMDVNYVGYVEGYDIFQHKADVIVCDGFVGNVVLKSSEGLMASMIQLIRSEVRKSVFLKLAGLAMKPVFRLIKQKSDPSEVGAAPLLGVQGNVLICHGKSDARALENALYKAFEAANEGLAHKISEAAKSLVNLKPAAEGAPL